MNYRSLSSLILAGAAALCTSCRTVEDVGHVPSDKLAKEGTAVFVRPDRYTILGTRSLRDYLEITYERAARNDTGLLKVEVGLRNRGGQRFYDLHGPRIMLSGKMAFYKDPITGQGPAAPPVYETNWQPITLVRGETEHFQAICPVQAGQCYQLTLSEILTR
jgi:hypothetical protein